MKKTSAVCHVRTLFTVCALAGLLHTPAFAQAYKGQTDFLEERAVKLFAEGDYAQSQREFERIQRMDPANAHAAEYLKKLQEKTGTRSADTRSSVQRVDGILGDMMGLRQNLINEEKSTGDLTYLIRNLITENDSLYVMLYKRARDIAELRSKFYGTPYADEYQSIMRSLPVDRVPQHLHQAERLMAGIGASSISVNVPPEAEVESLVSEIISRKKGIDNAPGLEKSLAEKRDLLVDQALAQHDRNAALTAAQEQLASANTRLKAAGSIYADTINAIDKYYQSVKNEIAAKNFTEQKQFADLMQDYTAKLKEADELRKQIENGDAKLAPSVTALEAANRKAEDLKGLLAAKDKQIAEFKDLLTKYKNELIQAEASLDKAGVTVGNIQALLEDSDTSLAELKAGISRMKALTAPGAKDNPELSTGDTQLTRELRDEITRLELRLKKTMAATPADLNATSGKEIAETALMKDQLKEKDRTITQLKEDFAALTAKMAKTEAELQETSVTVVALQNEKETITAAADERKKVLKGIEERINTMGARADDKNAVLDEQRRAVSELTAQLERLDRQAGDIRTALTEKDIIARKAEAQARTLETELTKAQDRSQRQDLDLRTLREKSTAQEWELNQLRQENDALLAGSAATPAKTPAVSASGAIKLVPAEPVIVRPVPVKQTPIVPAPVVPPPVAVKADTSIPDAAIVKKDAEIAALRKDAAAARDELAKTRALIKTYQEQSGTAKTLLEQKEALIKEIDKLRAKGPDVTTIQKFELDSQEKKMAASKLQEELDNRNAALNSASAEAAMLQEKLQALEIRQEAIKMVVQKRDLELQVANFKADTCDKAVAALTKERDALKLNATDRDNAAVVAEQGWKESRKDNARLQKEIDDLRATATAAHAELASLKLVNDKNTAELIRVKAQLTAKEAELSTMRQNLQDIRK